MTNILFLHKKWENWFLITASAFWIALFGHRRHRCLIVRIQGWDVQRFPGGRCTRRASCPLWWLCWVVAPAGWGLWRSSLGGTRRIPWRGVPETHPTDRADLPRGQHTAHAYTHTCTQTHTFVVMSLWGPPNHYYIHNPYMLTLTMTTLTLIPNPNLNHM